MAKPKNNSNNTQTQLTNEEESVNLTHLALGIFKSPKTGEWMLSRIKYNPVLPTRRSHGTTLSNDGRVKYSSISPSQKFFVP